MKISISWWFVIGMVLGIVLGFGRGSDEDN